MNLENIQIRKSDKKLNLNKKRKNDFIKAVNENTNFEKIISHYEEFITKNKINISDLKLNKNW